MIVSVATSIIGLASGAVGGVCNVCVGHPLDLVKVRQQMSYSTSATAVLTNSDAATTISLQQEATTVGMLQSIFRRDGFRGLYAGISAPLAAVIPAFAISFASYEFAKNRIQHHYNDDNSSSQSALKISQSAAAGAFSGIPVALVLGPTERIKCLMQMYPKNPNYSTFGRAIMNVYRQGGGASLTRGTFMTVCRDVPGNAAYFATYEYIKRLFANQLNNEYYDSSSRSQMMILSTVLAGGLAGVANWIVAIPFDVVKSRWQAAEPGQYANVRSVIQHLLHTRGPAAFFSGLTPALLRAFPANAACFLGAETAKGWLANSLSNEC